MKAIRLPKLFRPKPFDYAAYALARDRANLEVVLPWALAQAPAGLKYPVAYVEFLRSCLERQTLTIRTLKSASQAGAAQAGRRFATLVDALATVPPLELSLARQLASVVDEYLGNGSPLESGQWCGDIRAHFAMSSSFGKKGRILSAVIRFMRSRRCLELGTAYGMSAMFMLEAQAVLGPDTQLITVEGSPQMHDHAARLLQARYGARVRCELGWTTKVLPALADSSTQVDFMFHDAGHSRQDYVTDFQAALPLLAPGAVVLFDDIRWSDPRFAAQDPQCYKGWREVANHPRVAAAVEVGTELGMLLLT